jgi:hypothetical protein
MFKNSALATSPENVRSRTGFGSSSMTVYVWAGISISPVYGVEIRV